MVIPVSSALSQILQNDEFNSRELQPFWYVQNGDQGTHTMKDGQLVVEGAFEQDLWGDDYVTRFYQLTNQDSFTIETSMIFDHKDVASIAGLVIKSTTTRDAKGRSGEWVLLKMLGIGKPDEDGKLWWIFEGKSVFYDEVPERPAMHAMLQYQHREREIVEKQPDYIRPQGNIPVKLRIKREGNTYEAWYQPDARGEWVYVGKTTIVLQGPLQVGVYTGICQPEAPGHLTTSFDYFRVTPNPSAILSWNGEGNTDGGDLGDTTLEVSTGKRFTATLNIENALQLAGVQFNIHFNPAVLEVADIQEGDFLITDGKMLYFQVAKVDNVGGELAGIRIARNPGTASSGTLLKVIFKAKTAGNSAIEVRDLKIGDPAAQPIPTEITVLNVTVKPAPDINADGKVNILDLVYLAQHFGPAAEAPPGVDINGDGEIDIFDLILLSRYLGT